MGLIDPIKFNFLNKNKQFYKIWTNFCYKCLSFQFCRIGPKKTSYQSYNKISLSLLQISQWHRPPQSDKGWNWRQYCKGIIHIEYNNFVLLGIILKWKFQVWEGQESLGIAWLHYGLHAMKDKAIGDYNFKSIIKAFYLLISKWSLSLSMGNDFLIY